MGRPGGSGDRIIVGRVTGPHGLGGGVRVEVLSDDPARFDAGSRLTREGDAAPLTVVDSHVARGGLVVRFEEVADRDGAEGLRGVYLEAPPPPRRRGRYLWHEIVGTRVEDRDGRELGTVRELFRAGGGEVAVVEGPEGELLVPLVRAFVPRFAPRRGVMVVDAERLGSDASRPSRTAGALRAARSARAARPAGQPSARPTEGSDDGPATAAGALLEVDVVTLFPAMLEGPLRESIPGRVQERGLATLRYHDLRRWGLGRHRSVDDTTFGGGAGMVLRPEPVAAALDELRRPGSTVVLLDPGGERFEQAMARELARAGHLILLCARYEGVDERIRSLVEREISIGDYVLSGGEPAAIVVIDALLRLLPGAIESASVEDESFSDGLLEYPQYTRPRVFRGMAVPDVLVSGDHGAVHEWRRREAQRRTAGRRPDLLARRGGR